MLMVTAVSGCVSPLTTFRSEYIHPHCGNIYRAADVSAVAHFIGFQFVLHQLLIQMQLSFLSSLFFAWWFAAQSFIPIRCKVSKFCLKSINANSANDIFGDNEANWSGQPKLDFNEDYYAVLEVDPAAEIKDLKKAYFKMVFRYHPDNKPSEEAKKLCNKQMMVINAAYKTLKDPELRRKYDFKRSPNSFVNKNVRSTTTKSTSARSQSWTGFNTQSQQEQEENESLESVLADIARDLKSGGKGVLEDFVTFFEQQITDDNSSGQSGFNDILDGINNGKINDGRVTTAQAQKNDKKATVEEQLEALKKELNKKK